MNAEQPLPDLPADLRALLEDPGVMIRQDPPPFDLIAKWQQAKAQLVARGFHAGQAFAGSDAQALREALRELTDWASTLVPENEHRDRLIAHSRAALAAYESAENASAAAAIEDDADVAH